MPKIWQIERDGKRATKFKTTRIHILNDVFATVTDGGCLSSRMKETILGDPGAVSRVGRKGGTKVFKYGRKSPWLPTLTKLFPKIQGAISPVEKENFRPAFSPDPTDCPCNNDDDGSETSVKKKRNLRSFKLHRVYLDSMNMSNTDDFSWSWIPKGFSQVKKEEGKFVVACPRPP